MRPAYHRCKCHPLDSQHSQEWRWHLWWGAGTSLGWLPARIMRSGTRRESIAVWQPGVKGQHKPDSVTTSACVFLCGHTRQRGQMYATILVICQPVKKVITVLKHWLITTWRQIACLFCLNHWQHNNRPSAHPLPPPPARIKSYTFIMQYRASPCNYMTVAQCCFTNK